MKTFVVTSKATGARVYSYQSEEAVSWNEWPFETHDHTAEEVAEPTVLLQQPRRFTKLGFIGLLTPAEFIGLLENARASVDVEALIKMIDWATPDADQTALDRDDPRTIAGIRTYFSPERADEILGVTRV